MQAGDEYKWIRSHSWQSWRERYKNNQARFDKRIELAQNANLDDLVQPTPAINKPPAKQALSLPARQASAETVERVVQQIPPVLTDQARVTDWVSELATTAQNQGHISPSYISKPASRQAEVAEDAMDVNGSSKTPSRAGSIVPPDDWDLNLFSGTEDGEDADDMGSILPDAIDDRCTVTWIFWFRG